MNTAASVALAAPPPPLRLAAHALRRLNQRGVRYETLTLVLNYADTVMPAGGGREFQSLSRRRLAALRDDGVSPSLLERADRLTVLFDGDGCVVTVFRRDPRRRRRE